MKHFKPHALDIQASDLGLSTVLGRELPVLIAVISSDEEVNGDAEKILNDLHLIDDLLTLQKQKTLLIKKRGLMDQIDARIGMEVGIEPSAKYLHGINRKT